MRMEIDFVTVQSAAFVYEYVIVCVPTPAIDGVKTPVNELTPGPE